MICSKCKKERDESEFSLGGGLNETKCDRCITSQQKYYQTHRKQILERTSKYSKQNRAKLNAAMRKRRNENPEKQILWSTKGRAAKKGIPFNLTLDDIVIPERCPILGIPIKQGMGKLSGNSPSIDRIDPTKGYTKGNVQIISNRANTIKSDATIEELNLIVEYLSKLK